MEANVLFLGIYVDDKAYHVSVFDPTDERSFEFNTSPNAELLVRALKKHNLPNERIRLCYEATYIGVSLCRRLRALGFHCEIAAPSLIPQQVGVRQKTDKLDCKKLAKFYAKGLLTFIYICNEEDEAVRDLLRSRQFLLRQQTQLKNHITSLTRRLGFDYKGETGKKLYWTKVHLLWLQAKINGLKQAATKVNFRILMKQLEDTTKSIDLHDAEINHVAETEKYAKKTKVLCAFKGVKETTALTLITELGDIRRFDHPRRITSYAGFDLVEYSSGGKEKRYGISKFGNAYLQKAAVDAVKFAYRSPAMSPEAHKRKKGIDEETAKISSRCATRLYKKGSRMLYAGKPMKKIQVACAREFLGFVWEALQKAS